MRFLASDKQAGLITLRRPQMLKLKKYFLQLLFLIFTYGYIGNTKAESKISFGKIKECLNIYRKAVDVSPDSSLEFCGSFADIKNKDEILQCIKIFKESGVTSNVAFEFCTKTFQPDQTRSDH
ncbi:MAG: hypothetical protein HOP36_08610 [Methyloglobulus sp.]|nr:hypothetical protein [Methyloglobulus sp.]